MKVFDINVTIEISGFDLEVDAESEKEAEDMITNSITNTHTIPPGFEVINVNDITADMREIDED